MEPTKAITDSKTFFNDIDRHFEKMEDEDFKENIKQLTISKGRKIWLEVDVEDDSLTHYLFRWLYSKDEHDKHLIPFGCRLQSIHFVAPATPEIKQKLTDLLNSL